jgi:hypothetical protein
MKDTELNQVKAHAKASPSAYSRWGTCAGSLTLEQKLNDKNLLPPDESSPAAEEGTRLHDIAERALLGQDVEVPEVIQEYVDYCRELSKLGIFLVEAKAKLIYSPEETGTVDFAVYYDDVLHIVDLKSGRFPVPAENNRQLAIYALGLVKPETKTVRMTIHQGGVADTWEVCRQDLNEIAHEVMERAKLALDDEVTTLTPSNKACHWCPAKAYCPENAKIFFDDLEVATHSDLTRVSDEQMIKVLANKKKIQCFIDGIEKILHHRVVEAGEDIKGVRVSQGRKAAKRWDAYLDPVQQMEKAGIPEEQRTKTTPITATQALKLAPNITGWHQPESKPQIKVTDDSEIVEQFEEL